MRIAGIFFIIDRNISVISLLLIEIFLSLQCQTINEINIMKYSEFHRKILAAGWKFSHAEGSHYFYTKNGKLSEPAPYPVQTYAGTQYINTPVEIDEKTLTEIAGATNGNYFRATSNSKLKEVYQEIDKLEKTKLNVKEFSKREEEYQIFAWIAFFCILLEILLRNSVLKKIP